MEDKESVEVDHNHVLPPLSDYTPDGSIIKESTQRILSEVGMAKPISA